LQVRGISL